ncbi:hypothetical protein [Cryptosporangium sp. NPDC048952]|uniref:hypothetical protein n=1 Tax=Cryptosporangium sp. NPDC048952 TaxID=3363961 RepID=UPI003723F7F4
MNRAPRWAVVVAHTIPLLVLPAGLWRIGATLVRPDGEIVYVICLSVVSELLALSAVGLVAPWGEVVPSWVPGLRGRSVPARVVTFIAGLGAVALTVLWTAAAVAVVRNRSITGAPLEDPSAVPWAEHDYLFEVCYAPLLLWGPLLGVLTLARSSRGGWVGARPRSKPPCASG